MTSHAPDITERTQIDLSGRISKYYDPTGNKFDIAIGGMPFIMSVTDNTPYKRQTAPFRTDRYDTERDPGEHALAGSGYWIRSQSSWHYGEGIQFTEPQEGNDNEVRYRFRDSVGIDPWTPGQISLLRSSTNVLSLSDGCHLITANDGTNDILIAADCSTSPTTSLYKITHSGTVTSWINRTDLGGDKILDMCSDGTYLYVATPNYLYDINIATSAIHQAYHINTAVATSVTIKYVKSRVIAAVTYTGGAVAAYELSGWAHTGSATNLGSATVISGSNIMPSGWVWSSITEARAAIYLGGYAGDNSSLFSLTVDSAGALQSIVTAATMPKGERLYGVFGYLGTYVILGTNRGVRVASSDSSGALTYGPLVVTNTSANPVYDFDAAGSYVWAGVSSMIDGYSGTYRINLAQPLTLSGYASPVYTGVYARATDTQAVNATGAVINVVEFPYSASNPISCIGMAVQGSGIWIQSPTNLVDSGSIRHGRIRYSTLEPKSWKRIRVRTNSTLNGTVDIIKVNEGGLDEPITTIQEDDTTNFDYDLGTVYNTVATDASFKLTLGRSATDSTKGAVVIGLGVKALPSPTRARILQIPIFCFDKETDKLGNMVGYEGYARDRLGQLEQLEATGQTVIIQDFTAGGEPTEVIIEQVSFVRSTPSARNYSGFGGIIQVTARTLA